MRYAIKRFAKVYQDHSCQFLFVRGPEYVISNKQAWGFCCDSRIDVELASEKKPSKA